MPPSNTNILDICPLDNVAVAVAVLEGEPPIKVTVGAVLYPNPVDETVMLVTLPLLVFNTGVPVALLIIPK